jgi:hypothetical protein
MTLIPRNETSTRRRAGSSRATARVEVAVMAATAGAPVNNQSSTRAAYATAVGLTMKPVGKPDAGNRPVRFGEYNAAGDWLTAFSHYVASLWAADEFA